MTSRGTLGVGATVDEDAEAAVRDLSFVHPELREAAETFVDDPDPSIEASINVGALLYQAPRTDVPLAEFFVPVPDGPQVKAYVINSRAGISRPAVVHMHGGGFYMGEAAHSVRHLQDFAFELDCVVATVDYRLAPLATYADSIEDNYAVLRWVHAQAADLGVDPARIAVMGESAGGGHAALLALTARDRGEVPILFQILTYPMLDDRTGTSRKVPRNIGTLGWTAAQNKVGWDAFLGQQAGTADVPTEAVPARAARLEGLPPAFIGVGGIDLFVEENVDYARRLIQAGVRTELVVVPGAFHGFDVFAPGSSLARNFVATRSAAIRRALSGEV